MSDKMAWGKPVYRRMSLRHKPPVRKLAEQGRGELTDQSGNHKVTIQWKLNEDAERDGVFKLQIDDKVVYLDIEELTYYTRMFTQ